jgi:hypothetical protein
MPEAGCSAAEVAMSVPRRLVDAAARSRMSASGEGSRTMISWLADDEVDGGLVNALQGLDALFGATIVVEPFPDATFRDVLTDIHGELGVGSAESRGHRTQGRALWPLVESGIGTLIVVGADVLAAGVVADLMHLHGLDRMDRVVLIGRADADAYELFMAAGGRPGSADVLADIVSGYREPPIEVSPLAASYRGLHRTLINQIVFLSRRIEATM